MSRENVEAVRRANEAFNRGDYEGYMADLAPDFVYVASGAVPGGEGTYRGHNELMLFLRDLWDGFENVHAEIREVIETENRVVVSLTTRARGKQSGADTTWSFFQVITFRDGQATHGQGFLHRAEALEAVGLSE